MTNYCWKRHRANGVEAAALAKREMEGVAELKIPLKVDLKSGPNWAEMSGAA